MKWKDRPKSTSIKNKLFTASIIYGNIINSRLTYLILYIFLFVFHEGTYVLQAIIRLCEGVNDSFIVEVIGIYRESDIEKF